MRAKLTIGTIATLLVLLLLWGRLPNMKGAATLVTDPSKLTGMQMENAAWNPETAYLRSRVKEIGLPDEGVALHIHQHIDLNIEGTTVAIPAGIGIDRVSRFVSSIHTHDEDGVIHVESSAVRDFTLGEFFDVWGILFTAECINGYCADATRMLRVYENGALVSGNPRTLVLTSHQEIMVVYGEASSTPIIISSYTFPPGE